MSRTRSTWLQHPVRATKSRSISEPDASFQPAPEMVMLTGDRSMTAAQDADYPDRGPDDIALGGLLHLVAALSYAKVGQKGSAENVRFISCCGSPRRLGFVQVRRSRRGCSS
ncbi:hypothetical protein QMZ92_35125 [Streptomyces sp. HNM0645]|uniref:hypothetical protein n=1 Tax=Streptomyces sp. HNM0645 TaxID=2782343 RepID=UPI0024B86AB0|nr:hypothetical protein [Streptomyces sp. HNM0645]MDI9889405.1 hypothetical protein [Streptomyces sp. HNM0645]